MQSFSGTLWYQFCRRYSTFSIDLIDTQIIVRNNVLQFTDVDEPTFLYFYDDYTYQQARMHNVSVLVDNNTISQRCNSFCYLVYIFLPVSNITMGNMRVLNSNVTFRASLTAGATSIYADLGAVSMRSSALQSTCFLMRFVSVCLVMESVCGGSYDPYHSDASMIVVNIRSDMLLDTVIHLLQSNFTLQAISLAKLVDVFPGFMSDASVVVDTISATMELCNPTGYSMRTAEEAAPTIGVVSICGRSVTTPAAFQRVNITISSVNVNGSVRDDLLLGFVPLPLNTSQPTIGYSLLNVGYLNAGSDVALAMRESTSQVLIRVCLTTFSTLPPSFGIGFTIVNAALLLFSGVTLSSGIIHVDHSSLVLLESSTFMQQITTTSFVGVLGASVISATGPQMANVVTSVTRSAVRTFPHLPQFEKGTKGRFIILMFIIGETDLNALTVSGMTATPYAFLASTAAAATLPPAHFSNSTITLRDCHINATTTGSSALIRQYTGLIGFQNATLANVTLGIYSSQAIEANIPQVVPAVATSAMSILDGGTMTATTLICEKVTVQSTNSSLISAWLTNDVSPKSLPATMSSFRLSAVATLISSSSQGFPLLAAGPGARASLVDQSTVSLANMTMTQDSVCSSRTLATNSRVTFSETTPIIVGCDVKCDDGTSVLCNAHRWLGDVANSITVQTCPHCPAEARVTITDAHLEPSIPVPQPSPNSLLSIAQSAGVASSTAAVLAVSLFSSTIPSAGAAVAATSGIMRMSGALRQQQRCATFLSSVSSGDEDSSNSGSMFDDPADNPLAIGLSANAAGLRYAAGAAVGNTAIVIGVAFVSHLLAAIRQHLKTKLSLIRVAPMNQWEGRVIRVQRRGVSEQVIHGLITVLPRLRLPSTLLVPYAILLVPTISEVVALIPSIERSAVSVGIGVAVGIVWAGVAVVFTYVGLTCVAVSDGASCLRAERRSS
ncbi:transmembrane protein, putative [Bodo saltans]|uniref:Transmembrane protein, putative n=1 Tax=Bodo saltans TaxID=75058 RepID=A0A0S4JS01_BODSA|nr:transmembrane protein, putative [Bodo saltans]|eukprot:CUG94302.1 transmembrane protein, putative [Bodo saltans]